mgnify:CR=1 FL=1|jgi:hypothetical protein
MTNGDFLEGVDFPCEYLRYYQKYTNLIRTEPEESVWFDIKNKLCFGSEQVFSVSPADFSFFATPEDFLDHPRWGMEKLKEAYPSLCTDLSSTNEYIISKDPTLEAVSGSKILIIGGGPSTLDTYLDQVRLGSDQVWACNNFHQSEVLKNITIDVASIGPTVDTTDKEFKNRTEKDSTLCLLDGGVTPYRSEDIPQKSAIYHTRYFSKLGMIPRMIVLAAQLGAKEISVVGFDGYPDGHKHAFENGKNEGNQHNTILEALYNRQIILFWEYVTSITDARINNLGEGHIANQSTEITRSLFGNKK